MDQSKLNKINEFRLKNNSNTINILRLATKHFPEESKRLLIEVNHGDAKISKLLKELEAGARQAADIIDDLEELRAKNNGPWMKLYELAQTANQNEYLKLKSKADEYSGTINQLNDNQKVLVLAAHPDDETLGCGATINSLAQEGHEIQLLTFTDGVSSRRDHEKNRNPQLSSVSKVLGINRYNSADFPDNAMDSVPLLDLSKFIERHVSYVPDIIFTHFIGDLNVDHQLVAKATLTAFRPQSGDCTKIYSYYVPSSTDYNPISHFNGNSYFNISADNVNKKLEALKIYDKEMRPPPHSRSYDNIHNLMKVWGSEIGLSYAEKFQLIREVT